MRAEHDYDMPSSDLGRLWASALEMVDKGSPDQARTAIAAALTLSPHLPRLSAFAARLYLLIDDFALARRCLDDASAAGADDIDLLVSGAFTDGMLGDFPTATAAFEALYENGRMPSEVASAAVALAASVYSPEAALRWSAIVGVDRNVTPARLLRTAEMLLHVGEDAEAGRLIRDALDRAPTDPTIGRIAGELFLTGRECAQAAELFHDQLTGQRQAGSAHLGLAVLHLWRGELAMAVEHAREALAHGSDVGASQRVLACAALLDHNAHAALVQLSALVGESPRDPELRTWKAEALLRCRQLRAACVEARAAAELTPERGTPAIAQMIEALACLRLGRRPIANPMVTRAVAELCGTASGAAVSRLTRRVWAGRRVVWDQLLAIGSRLFQGLKLPVVSVEPPTVADSALDRALAALGGNRSPLRPTRVDGGMLSRLTLGSSVRAQAKVALQSVRIGGYPEARRRLDALTERYPHWPHPWFYRAELLMWVDLLDDARRDLEHALTIRIADPEMERPQWPPIGLAGVCVLSGQPRDALRIIRRARRRFWGPPAQPYYAWCGEVLRAVGRLEEAADTLKIVCPPDGCRIGSMLTLALTYRDLGDREQPRRLLAEVMKRAPGMVLEVALNTSSDNIRNAVFDPSAASQLSDDETRQFLELARYAMRGNRSAACLTFVDASGRLRAIPPNGFYRFVDSGTEIRTLHSAFAQL
jgi:Flp pilus assembly protein TadD